MSGYPADRLATEKTPRIVQMAGTGAIPIYRWLAKGINAYMISLYPRRDTSTAADRPLNCDRRLLNECPFLMTIIAV